MHVFLISFVIFTNRSEGFARAAYFVPGRDGIGVWPISEIVPAPASVTNISDFDNFARTRKNRSVGQDCAVPGSDTYVELEHI